MYRMAKLTILALALALGFTHPALAGQRVALVVGEGAYAAAGRLDNPPHDADLVRRALEQAGFATIMLTNATHPQFQAALRTFRDRADGAEIALVYYAGHGIEAGGKNWLIPVDARLSSDFDLGDEAIELDRVLDALGGAKLRVVVLDACRNNPFGAGWKSAHRSVSRGLARVEADDVMVLYAAAPGQTASDGNGTNSPFATSLAQRLVQPGLALQLLGGAVRDDVLSATGGAQRPFVSASVTGTPIYLVGAVSTAVPATPVQSAQSDRSELEALLWKSVAERNAADGYQNYLDQFRNGIFAAEARARLAALSRNTPQAQPAGIDYYARWGLTKLQFDTQDSVALLNLAGGATKVEALRKAAEAGDPVAGTLIGVATMQGVGVAVDQAQALRWLHKAADLGSATAMSNIGIVYEDGWGVAKDDGEALRWYRKAAELGNAYAMTATGFFYKNSRGVAQNYSEAARWYRMAADLGDAPGMANIGLLYQNGYGVAQDYGEAMRWYRKAADLGNAGAMNSIGFLFGHGLGISLDYAEAMRWYRKAADLRNPQAMNNVGTLYARGEGVTENYGEAMNWFQKAADLGEPTGMEWIGYLYENGKGVVQDRNEARRWYEKAAALGDQVAKDALTRLGAK